MCREKTTRPSPRAFVANLQGPQPGSRQSISQLFGGKQGMQLAMA